MIFFYVLKDIRVNTRGSKDPIQFKSPRSADIHSRNIPDRYVYFTTQAQFERLIRSVPDARLFHVLDDVSVDMILHRDSFPKEIGFYQPGKVNEIFSRQADSVKIAIINGMGIGIGDSIVGLRALEIFHDRIRGSYSSISIDIYQRIKPELQPLYQRSRLVNKVYMLPQSLDRLLSYDYYMSLEAFTQSDEFNAMPMMDYFLAKLGVDPASVAASDKRNTNVKAIASGKKARKELDKLLAPGKDKGEKFLLFHPHASDAIRSIPDAHIPRIMDYLIANTDFTVVSASKIPYAHQRFIDLSQFSQGVDDFIDIIARMDAVITVDTSACHIADGFSIPAVVLFTTIPPQYRISCYPHARGMWLGEGKAQLFMRHKGGDGQDWQLIEDIYSNLDHEKLLALLDEAIKSIVQP